MTIRTILIAARAAIKARFTPPATPSNAHNYVHVRVDSGAPPILPPDANNESTPEVATDPATIDYYPR